MPHPFTSLLPALRSRLEGLVDATAWEGLLLLAGRLPAVWSFGCFEVRLAASDPRVDFSCSVSHGGNGPAALAQALAAGEEVFAAEPLRPLLESWSRPDTLLSRHVPTLWLEYDLPGGQPQAPCFFLTFMRPGGHGCCSLSPPELRGLVESALRLLPRRPGDEERLALMEHAARALPAEGRLYHVGTLPEWRQTRALRLNATLPSSGSLGRWLRELGWTVVGSRQWRTALDLMGDEVPTQQVGIDLDRDVVPRLALETSRHPRSWPDSVRRLVDRGACDERKGRAVLAWPGSDALNLPDSEWRTRIDRELAALKVVVDPRGEAEAKAYLGFRARHALV